MKKNHFPDARNKKFCIGIPTINRIDLLFPTLLFYSMDLPNVDIIIYDNGKQRIDDKLKGVRLIRGFRDSYENLANVKILGGNGVNIGVAGAWNAICKEGFKDHDNVLILNDDIYFKTSEFDMECYIDAMRSLRDSFLGCEHKYNWSSFLISRECFGVVGSFDETFAPAYLEDMDYLYRMSLLKNKGMLSYSFVPALNPTVFRKSSSMQKDEDLAEQIHQFNATNRKYYELKWGGEVGKEIYQNPFGG